MYFHHLRDFLAMGGFAAYVWSAFGLTWVALIINVYVPLRQHRYLLKKLAQKKGDA